MRVIQTVVAVAILVVLTIIAIDLHRVAGELAPVRDVSAGLMTLGTPPGETHAQLVDRLRRQAQEVDEYVKAFAEANGIKQSPKTKSPR